jgi:hypothetical protein
MRRLFLAAKAHASAVLTSEHGIAMAFPLHPDRLDIRPSPSPKQSPENVTRNIAKKVNLDSA